MSYRRLPLPALALLAVGGSIAVLLSGRLTSHAVQNPTISLDMVTTGNGYCDSEAVPVCSAGISGGPNQMVVGTVDQCATETLNNAEHVHSAHLIIQNVEDLVGWQARFNYLANRMRFLSGSSTPFNDIDPTTLANVAVGFTNLPIDPAGPPSHRAVTAASAIEQYPESSVSVASAAGATTISVANATGFAAGQTIGIGTTLDRETGRVISAVSGNQLTFSPALVNAHAASATEVVNVTDQVPQTALFGSAYNGTQTFPLSPDTPAKNPPDDTSYTALTGGILASVSLRIEPDQGGQPSLFMNLDDSVPNAPGSAVVVFNGAGTTTTLKLASSALGDGYVGQGTTCVPLDCVTQECPPATPTPTPCSECTPMATPTPTATPTPAGASATPTAEATGSPGPCPPDGFVIDFAGFLPGTIMTEQYASRGVHIAGVGLQGFPDAVLLYDSDATPPPDLDLFVDLGNIALLPQNLTDANHDGLVDQPRESNYGGKQIYTFDHPVHIGSFLMIDKNHGTPDHAFAYDAGGNLITTALIPVGTAGSVQKIGVNADNVSELVIDYRDSAALTRIEVNCVPGP